MYSKLFMISLRWSLLMIFFLVVEWLQASVRKQMFKGVSVSIYG